MIHSLGYAWLKTQTGVGLTLMVIFGSLVGFQAICLPLPYPLPRVMNIILRGFVVG